MMIRLSAIAAATAGPLIAAFPALACKSKPGFGGADSVVIEADFKHGFVGRFSYDIEVR